MGSVSLTRTRPDLRDALADALGRIGGPERFVARGDRVLLKPNLNGVEGCTDRPLVETLVRMLSDLGAARIFIAESTFGNGDTTDRLFRETGYADLARRYGIGLFNLNRSEAVEVPVDDPLVLDTLRIAREVFEADKIINLPNMKVHYATGVTLALKNMKGLLVGDAKRHCHEVGLDKAIVDLNRTIRPHLTIVDAISCMERMGPRGGDPVRLDLILAGGNPAEVDCVGCAVMGFDVGEVRHLSAFLEADGVDPCGITVVGEPIENVRRPFRKVTLDGIVPGTFRVRGRSACSSCMNAFLLSCSLLERDPGLRADVVIGPEPGEFGPAPGTVIAFGNCCPEERAYDIRVRGCPPYPFALEESLKDRPGAGGVPSGIRRSKPYGSPRSA